MATPELTKAIEALKAELTRDNDVNHSAETLITQLLADIEANKDAPAEIQKIVDAYRAQTDELATAVAAGTTPPPTP